MIEQFIEQTQIVVNNCKMDCKTPENSKNDDEISLMSIRSFKNRFHLARDTLISNDVDVSTCPSTLTLVSSKSIGSSSDVNSGDNTNSELNSNKNLSFTSPRYDSHHDWSDILHNHYQKSSLQHSIPPEIAVLHEETSSILDSVSAESSISSRSRKGISPIKDRFYRPINSKFNDDYSCDDDLQLLQHDTDDESVTSLIMDDDDGMRTELKRLEYVTRTISREMEQLSYHYDYLVHTQEDEEEKDDKNNTIMMLFFGSLERLFMVIILLSVLYQSTIIDKLPFNDRNKTNHEETVTISKFTPICEQSTKPSFIIDEMEKICSFMK